MHQLNVTLSERHHNFKSHPIEDGSLVPHERMLLRAQRVEERAGPTLSLLVPLAVVAFVAGFLVLCFTASRFQAMGL